MPELPDITAYVEAIDARVRGRVLESVRVRGVSLLRTVEPTVEETEGRRVIGVERLGKRVVLSLEGGLFVVVHLMIAGRFRWLEADERTAKTPGARPSGIGGAKAEQARLRFDSGTLVLIESGTKKRATMHVVKGRDALRALHAGGLDVFQAATAEFIERLRSNPRTLKRALTDPRLVDGIGNAYSDEILHAAGLSPVARVSGASDAVLERLHAATRVTLTKWTEKLRRELKGKFPSPAQVTAFRPDFAVHGKFGQPCPTCGTNVQRIVYAENECNYCPRCQCGGRILADRSLSRLLRDDWPKTVEELEGEE